MKAETKMTMTILMIVTMKTINQPLRSHERTKLIKQTNSNVTLKS